MDNLPEVQAQGAVQGMAEIPRIDTTALLQRVEDIQFVIDKLMKKDIHFGVIPGTKKPTIYKAGAETMLLAFQMTTHAETTMTKLDERHRDYYTETQIIAPSGKIIAIGQGSCSTMEKKYRWRTGPKELTDNPVPKEYWDLRKTDPKAAQKLIGVGNSTQKNEAGAWMIASGGGAAIENPDIADSFNTCLKISKKRSLNDGTLIALAISAYFTQDIEDMPEFQEQQTKADKQEKPPMQQPQAKQDTQAPQDAPQDGTERKGDASADQIKAMHSFLSQLGIDKAFRDEKMMRDLGLDIEGWTIEKDLMKSDATKLYKVYYAAADKAKKEQAAGLGAPDMQTDSEPF